VIPPAHRRHPAMLTQAIGRAKVVWWGASFRGQLRPWPLRHQFRFYMIRRPEEPHVLQKREESEWSWIGYPSASGQLRRRNVKLLEFFRPKWRHSDPANRRAAAKKTTNQHILEAIAKNDKDALARAIATKNLADPVLLADIAKNDNQAQVRMAAVERITNQTVLFDIARKDDDQYVRTRAVGRLRDQSKLISIARNDIDYRVRRMATKKLTDQTVLAEIARNDMDWLTRAIAAEKLTDQETLAEIAKIDDNHHVRARAVERLTDEAALTEISGTEKSEDVVFAIRAKLNLSSLLPEEKAADKIVDGLDGPDFHDIEILQNKGVISVSACGISLHEIEVTMRNFLVRQIKISIAVGCTFNGSGRFQNMAVCKTNTRILLPNGTYTTRVSAVCVNARRRVPNSNDVFAGFAGRSEAVANLLRGFSGNTDKETLQLAVWLLTDSIDFRDSMVLFGVSPGHHRDLAIRFSVAEGLADLARSNKY
jgi:hypothetical protein